MLACGWQCGWVPRFEPFRALRYTADHPLDLVSAPPYDVLSDDDVASFAAKDPHNIVIIDVPGAPADHDEHDDRYEVAGRRLRRWTAESVLRRDDADSFTLYRMTFTDTTGTTRHTVGVIGALEVVDEGADGVLAHERTTPKAASDRLELTRATGSNLSPVWGLSLTAGLSGLLGDPGEPVGECTDEHGVLHRVERITDPHRLHTIATAVAASPVLIADGHHRYAVARSYRDEVRNERGADTPAELTMAYVAELVEDQLSIDPIHRLYHGVTADDLLARLGPSFETSDAGRVDAGFVAEAVRRGALCLVRADGNGVWLTPRPELAAAVRALDGAYLEHALTAGDAGARAAIEVTYQHGVDEVLHALSSGRADAAVLIRPTSIAEIRRTAEERLLMPPKSTFFTPKLRTGPVLRPLWGGSTLSG